MTIIKKYTEYIKNNPEGYWFKRKLFGWGWIPVTWQGWLVTLAYIGLVLTFALTVNESSSHSEIVFTFILPVTLLTITLIRIGYKKGEKPKWQWGFPEDK